MSRWPAVESVGDSRRGRGHKARLVSWCGCASVPQARLEDKAMLELRLPRREETNGRTRESTPAASSVPRGETPGFGGVVEEENCSKSRLHSILGRGWGVSFVNTPKSGRVHVIVDPSMTVELPSSAPIIVHLTGYVPPALNATTPPRCPADEIPWTIRRPGFLIDTSGH